MRQLLLIDQHTSLTRKLQASLLFEGVEVIQVRDGRQATVRYQQESSWDLIVVGDSGNSINEISVLMKLRAIDKTVPILTIIHSNHAKDRIRMFYLGANDVISHPFAIQELVIRALNLIQLTTRDQADRSTIEVDELIIQTESRLVSRGEDEILLTPTEYDLLLFLSREAGKVHSRESILYEVWGYEFHGNTNIVDVYIRYLRIKIDKGHKKKLIRTIRGVGYMISA